MEQLNRNRLNCPSHHPERVLQFGGGNFLRAFADSMIEILNRKTDFDGSVIVVKPTKGGDYAALRSQDGLYHAVIDGVRDGNMVSEISLITCIRNVIHAYEQWDAFLATAEQPEIRFIISNTTEAGIAFSDKDSFDDDPPKEFPAKLTRWLYHRFLHFDGNSDKGCIVLPCELIEENGKALHQTVIKYASHWGLSPQFQTWLNTSNFFCNTLVDRIVSGYPTDREHDIMAKTGFQDALMVAGELYHSWIIEAPSIVEKELPLSGTDLNVQFVEDLSPYRKLKVHILNGAHTAMVPVGYLAGLRTVKDCMDDDMVVDFVRRILMEEIGPMLQGFPKEEVEDHIHKTLDRFKNPTLKHFLLSISLNSISKFKTRLLPVFEAYCHQKGTFPKRIAFSLACLIRFYKGEFNGEQIVLNDDEYTVQFFNDQWNMLKKEHCTILEMVKTILSNRTIFNKDLTQYDGLTGYVANVTLHLEENGVKSGLQNL
ncbi:tagaturonate reductase [Allomuricauda sp. SCSIO 65647]|uniref:tagaturonate reductase n=1 Tax=Allomuricauda sp. SCSIO 65647 TaxID=2908843 RepID=UPI001F26F34F|nr:tagaturonate reductase [Muricauda sp. SCSIO 65647]UJH68583.1 tagaturonate reductase [Muricauda sp. SCSIO 65647]